MRAWREGVAVALLTLVPVGWLVAQAHPVVPGTAAFASPGDHWRYLAMATRGLGAYRIAPFSWRIGTPFLASLLPFGVARGFFLLSVAGIWLTGMALFGLVRHVTGSWWGAALAVALFYSLPWATQVVVDDFWLPDPLTFLAITMALWCLVARYDLAFVVVLMLGVVVKETALFVMPLAYTLRAQRLVDRAALLRAVALTLPALAVLAVIRHAMPAGNDDPHYLATLPWPLTVVNYALGPHYSYADMFTHVGLPRLLHPLGDLRAYTVGSLGIGLPVLALAALRSAGGLALRLLPYVVLVYSQVLFATNIERLVVYAFPALLLLAAAGLPHLRAPTVAPAPPRHRVVPVR